MPMVKFCLHCNRHYEIGTGVRGRCGDCGRAYDRELSRQKRARRARSSAAWQKARALAKQRDGGRCVSCGATAKLEVHHRVSLENGGAEFDLKNLVTLCVGCHGEQHRGDPGSTGRQALTPASKLSRKKLQRVEPSPRFSRNTLHDGDGTPFIG
jgi:5-methylcytosine-specific restriction endonuclease McrA